MPCPRCSRWKEMADELADALHALKRHQIAVADGFQARVPEEAMDHSNAVLRSYLALCAEDDARSK